MRLDSSADMPSTDLPIDEVAAFRERRQHGFDTRIVALDGTTIELSTASETGASPCSVIRVTGPGAAGDSSELAVESLPALQALVESGALCAMLAAHRDATVRAAG